jgi:hypothetical protein
MITYLIAMAKNDFDYAENLRTAGQLATEMAAVEVRLTDKIAAVESNLVLWIVGTRLSTVALITIIFKLMHK